MAFFLFFFLKNTGNEIILSVENRKNRKQTSKNKITKGQNNMSTLLKNCHLISPDVDLDNAAILIEGEKIKRIFAPGDELPNADEVNNLVHSLLVAIVELVDERASAFHLLVPCNMVEPKEIFLWTSGRVVI